MEMTNSELMDPKILDELGYKVTSFDGQYGKAESKKNGGKIQLQYNLKGYSVGYNGEKLPPNICLGVKDDWGTRTTFNGMIRSFNDLKTVLEIVR